MGSNISMCRMLRIPLLVAVMMASQPPLLGWATDAPSGQVENRGEPESLDVLLTTIKERGDAVTRLEEQLGGTEGILRVVTEKRLANERVALMEDGLAYASALLKQQEDTPAGTDAYQKRANAILALHPALIRRIQQGIRSRTKIPEPGLSAADETVAYGRIFGSVAELDRLYELSIRFLVVAGQLGMDVSEEEANLKQSLSERVANFAVLLELATEEVRGLNEAAAVLPDDADLKASLRVAETRVRNLAEALSNTIALMTELGMETTVYNEQAIAATGQITSGTLDTGVMTRLLLGWGQKITNVAIEEGPDLALKVLLFVGIVFLFKKLSHVSKKLMNAALDRSTVRFSELLRRMVISTTGNVVFVFGVLIALSQIGISLGPLFAGLGVAGFVIGFALQNTLSNFASGMMILLYKPFDVGDLVNAGGAFGTVSKMSLVSTTILTVDNQTIVVPNDKIWGDLIKNATAQDVRRVDLVFGISYSDDIPKAEKVLQEVVEADVRVLDSPEPMVRVHELGDSSVNFVVRPWVKTADYWETYWGVTRAVNMRFDEEGISIPFPQRDMHLDASEPLRVRIASEAEA